MVILGNPPYSGHSANTGKWIAGLLRGSDSLNDKPTENYFTVDGQPLGERNPKYLNDDYVKFIRFSQWRIDQTGYGILAFVTNHGYLDNPTFRGMRQSLMKTFDEIYVLDLHGNSKKKERSPDGTTDQNVFDIMQGVSIGIFVKKQSSPENQNPKTDAKVFHKHLYGVREIWTENVNNEKELTGGKYQWLSQNDISTTEWKEIKPQSTFYLFTPQNTDLFSEYEKGWKITDMMPLTSTGIKTHRDHFVIDFDKSELEKRIKDFCDLTISDSEISKKYNLLDTDSFKLSKSRKALKESKEINKSFTKILYRPFDTREYFHNELLVDRARTEIMQHLLMEQKNIALLLPRQLPDEFKHVLASRTVVSTNTLATAGRFGAGNVFPLYIYPTEKRGLFDEESIARKPNFSDEFIKDFSAKLKLEFVSDSAEKDVLSSNFSLSSAAGKDTLKRELRTDSFTPEDVFNYAYAVFHSPTYRARYAEFLKIDFPRLPLTSNYLLFFELARLGEQLVELHLLEKDIETDVTFPEKGSNEVEFVKFEESKIQNLKSKIGQVWINKTQYFDNVPETAWNFHIGGYQVLQKWLKDRKGRTLSIDDLEHYTKVVSALSQTIELMRNIDETIEANGGFPIE
jgi:predicted helicase